MRLAPQPESLRRCPVAELRPDLRNRFLGCLIGCAVGDALGAPFEGYWGHLLPEPKAPARAALGIGPFAALATRRRLDVEALLLVSVGIGVGGTRGGSQGGIILQPGDLALDVADGLASGMPDRNPALTGQLYAVVRRGRFGRAGRPRSVVGLEVADGLDQAFATDARHRTRSRPGIAGWVRRGQIARRCRSRSLGSRGRLNDYGYGRHQGRRVAIGIGTRSANQREIAGQRLGHARLDGRGR
jgi:hypothetical protein